METKNRKRLYVILAILVIGLAAAAGTYYLRQSTINDLKTQNRTATANNQMLKAQVDSLQNTIKQLSPSSAPAVSPSSPPAYSGTVVRSEQGVAVVIYAPALDSKVASPVGVIGLIPGNWSFEAQFPIKLEDSNGVVIGQTAGHVVGPWMTTNLVPFYAQVAIPTNPGSGGAIVIQKDNPSGIATYNDSVTIPVRF